VEENRVLKQEVHKYQKQAKSTPNNNNSKSKPKSSDRDLLKGLRLMDEARIRAQPKESQQPPPRKEATNHCSTKYGAQANRLALAMQKQRKKPAPLMEKTNNVSEDALLRRDHSREARTHTILSTTPLARSHSLGSRSASTPLRSDETARRTSSDQSGLTDRSSHRPSPLATSLSLSNKKRKGHQGLFASRFASVPDF
jgi:hypothetical protein